MAKPISELEDNDLVSLTDLVVMNNVSRSVSTPLGNVLYSAFQKSSTPLTIASGSISPTNVFHTVLNESNSHLDSIENINGSDSPFLFLSKHSTTQDIRISGLTSNVSTPNNETIVLTEINEVLSLFNYGTKADPFWVVVARSASKNVDSFNFEPSLDIDFSRREFRKISRINESVVSSYLHDVFNVDRVSPRNYHVANGKIILAPQNEIGFDHFPNNVKSGLNVNSASTNLLLRSQDFTNSSWIKLNIQSTSNSAGISPDGGDDLNFILPNSSTTQHSVRQEVATVVGKTYTTSVFIKPSTDNYQLRIRHGEGGTSAFINDANFNPLDGSVTRGNSNGRSFYIPYLNMHRVSLPFTATTTTTRIEFAIHATNTTSSWAGNGSSGLLMWGAQVNEGYLNSYTPTTSATSSCVLDKIHVSTEDSWFNDSPNNWCLVIDYYLPDFADAVFTSSDYRRTILSIGNSPSENLRVFSSIVDGQPKIGVSLSGTSVTTQTFLDSSSLNSEFNKLCKLALSWDGSNLLVGLNGVTKTIEFEDPLQVNDYSKLFIGSSGDLNLSGMNGKILNLKHYSKSFSESEITRVTS